jgi:hypothetical protein
MSTNTWSKEELRQIADADDLHISPFREDGLTYRTPTTFGCQARHDHGEDDADCKGMAIWG